LSFTAAAQTPCASRVLNHGCAPGLAGFPTRFSFPIVIC